MRVRRLPDAAAFLDVAGAFLSEREAMHSLLLGATGTSKADPTRDEDPSYFAAALDGDHVVGAALMTPPNHLQLSSLPEAAIDALVADLAAGGWNPTGVIGPVATSDAFAAAWCAARGPGEPSAGRFATARVHSRADVHMNLRAFELTSVVDPPATSGRMRAAESSDEPLVGRWSREFDREAGIPAGPVPAEERARRAIRAGRVFLWDDGGAVAQTVVARWTPNGAGIVGVYTPETNRRRGYATALVAEVSRAQLAAGRKFCFLLTDLSNPTSNSIYPKVGYRALADFREYDFVDAP